jgi:hypothetical protein
MNDEAILKSLIESGHVTTHAENGNLITFDELNYYIRREEFDTGSKLYKNSVQLLIQRALFDECGKRGYVFVEFKGMIYIIRSFNLVAFDIMFTAALDHPIRIYTGDTSRESFLAAFCKVVGI